MFSFLYAIFDKILDWIGLSQNHVSLDNGLTDVIKDSLYEHIEYDKQYIENRKKHSKYTDIQQIYNIIRKDYNLTISDYVTHENLIKWFDESILEANDQKNTENKIKLLLLKVEYEKWRDIEKRNSQMQMKQSLLFDQLSIDDYIEIMNES